MISVQCVSRSSKIDTLNDEISWITLQIQSLRIGSESVDSQPSNAIVKQSSEKEVERRCPLCKSPIDSSKGKSQALRIRLELEFQVRESIALKEENERQLEERKAQLRRQKRQLTASQRHYDDAVSYVRSTHEERKAIDAAVSESGVYLLRKDENRQDEFMRAQEFVIDYSQNMAYISNQRIKLPASSAFYLKMVARFALLCASLKVDSMMYPRLLFSDNMEDEGVSLVV